MNEQLLALLARFAERNDVVHDGADGKPPRLRSTFTGARALKSNLSKSRLRELAIAAGVPAPGSNQPGEWQDSDADRVVTIAFTDEGLDRHGTIFPVDGWRFDAFLRNPAVLLNHNMHSLPVGLGLLIERKTIVGADGKRRAGYVLHTLFSREELNPEAEVVFRNVVAGRLRGASHSFAMTNVRYADEGDAKKHGVPLGTPMLEAELLEVSIVTVGSNPNVGPGRAMATAEACALAAARTADGGPLFSQKTLATLYGQEIADAAGATDFRAAAQAVTWEDLEAAVRAVDAALLPIEEARALALEIQDAETPAEFAASKQSPAAPQEPDPIAALRALLSEVRPATPGVRTLTVDGQAYVHEGDAETVRRRRALVTLAQLALSAAGQDNPPEPHVLIRLDGDEDLRLIATEVRSALAEVRSLLAALDPLGSAAGGRLADAALGCSDLLTRLKTIEKKTDAALAL